MEIKLNGFVREFTRRTIKLPTLQKIQGCDWVDEGGCETVDIRTNLIQSGDNLEKKLRYSIRSIDEIKNVPADKSFCSIGPEFQRILTHPDEIRVVAKAFSRWSGPDLEKEDRKRIVGEVEKIISEDIRRRGTTIGMYALYFTLALFLLVQQYSQWRNVPGLQYPILMLTLLLVPIITTFYLHVTFADRLRTSGILHILPLTILAGYILYSVIAATGPTIFLKMMLSASQWVLIVAAIYVLYYMRRQYEECYTAQTGGGVNSRKFVLWGIIGVILPALAVSILSYTF